MLTRNADEGSLYCLHEYDFDYEDEMGNWMKDAVWSSSTRDAMREVRRTADELGTGRYRLYGHIHKNDHGMWRDETGMLHVTREEWNRTSRDFKGVYSDYRGEHPEWKGLKEIMPPCELGYTTCLLLEGFGFVMEEDAA